MKLVGTFLIQCGVLLGVGRDAPDPSSNQSGIAVDVAEIRRHPIGEWDEHLASYPITRQIQMTLYSRMHVRESVLGESLFERYSGRCLRAAMLDVTWGP